MLEQEAEQLQKQLPIMQQEIDQLSKEATRKEEVGFKICPFAHTFAICISASHFLASIWKVAKIAIFCLLPAATGT